MQFQRVAQGLLITLIVSIILLVGFVYGVYFYGINLVSFDIPQPPQQLSSKREIAYLGATEELDIQNSPQAMSPLSFTWNFMFEKESYPNRSPAHKKLALFTLATRILSADLERDQLTQGQHHVSNAALSIRLSQKWTGTEAASYILQNMYAGKRSDSSFVLGTQQAARHYYERDIGELSDCELAFLISMFKGPSYFDPYKHRERSLARFEKSREKLAAANIHLPKCNPLENLVVHDQRPTAQ
jgi:hypothetical protein